ncbi:MAG: hypothetical protein ACYC1M_12765 [Armatimonadota bacterium]
MKKHKIYTSAAMVLLVAALVPLLQGCSRSQQSQNSSVPTGNASNRPKKEDMRYGMQLMGLFDGVRQLETKGQNKLSAQQARDMAAVITTARSSDTFSETNAKDAIRSVQLILTAKQRTEIGAMIPEHGFRKGHKGGPGGPVGAGGPSGSGGPGGAGPGGPGGPPPGGGLRQGGASGAPQGGPGMSGNMMQSPPIDELLDVLKKKAAGS